MQRRVADPLALAVLAYLVQRHMHPYELGRTLREHGDAAASSSTGLALYGVKQLSKAGSSRAGDHRDSQRRAHVYALTDAGRTSCRLAQRARPGAPARVPQSHALSLIAAYRREAVDSADAVRGSDERAEIAS